MNVELYLREMGERIMQRRKKLGLTQEALAELSELTTQFVSYESGCCTGCKHRLPFDRRYH